MCEEKEKLQREAHELKRRLLLCQRKRELEAILDTQVSCDMVSEPQVPSGGVVPSGQFAMSVTAHLALSLCPPCDTTSVGM